MSRPSNVLAIEEGAEAHANRRILVVDDNKAIHEDFRQILAGRAAARAELDALHHELFGGAQEPAGPASFDLESAYQGLEAVELVCAARKRGRPYALAFVDVRMPPGIDGVETTAMLLAEDPDLCIVICSAYSDHGWEDMARAFGETDRVLILKKPFDPVEVRQLAHSLQKRWVLKRMVELKMEDLALMVDLRTAELKDANDRLRAEAEAREEALRKLAESNEQIKALAYQDGLTGLPNRRLLNEHMEKVLARARRKNSEFAVLFLDFDNFKLVNDTIGHQAADALLQTLARSLTDLIRSEDVLGQYAEQDIDAATTISIEPITDSVLSRLGGDEFVILLPDTKDRFAAGSIASRILAHLEHPVRAEDTDVVVTASIGIATYPEDGQTAEALIRNADRAMYHAKQKGRAGYQYYSAAMNAASVERLTLESALRRAVEEGSLDLHYQPQIDLDTGRIVGAEALLRWSHPQLGDIPPSTFVPIAEDTGLIVQIGEWVLRTACSQAVEWQRAGLPPLKLAVNVSGVQFKRQEMRDVLDDVLASTGLDPALLDLEITETAIMSVRDRAVEQLEQLRALGLSLSLDDFGTGYSSLSYLKRFPISTLKIDRSFTAEILTDAVAASIVEAIVSMTRILGLRVVVEGVEDREQVEALRRLGCEAAQGYYFSRALPAQEFARLLEATVARRSPITAEG